MSDIFRAEINAWTATTSMGALLDRTEQLFGKRVMEWTPIGVQIGKADQLDAVGQYRQAVHLPFSRGREYRRCLVRTAHEVIHLPAAVALEEGVAAWFSIHYDCPQISAPTKDLPFLETHRPQDAKAYDLYRDFRRGGGDIKVRRSRTDGLASEIICPCLLCRPKLRGQMG